MTEKIIKSPDIMFYTEDFVEAWWSQVVSQQIDGLDEVVACYLDDCDLNKVDEIISKIRTSVQYNF